MKSMIRRATNDSPTRVGRREFPEAERSIRKEETEAGKMHLTEKGGRARHAGFMPSVLLSVASLVCAGVACAPSPDSTSPGVSRSSVAATVSHSLKLPGGSKHSERAQRAGVGMPKTALVARVKLPTRSYRFEVFDGVSGALSTTVNSINDFGDTVGNYFDAQGDLHGFVRHAGVMKTVDVPGALGTDWRSVTDFGVIIGGFGDVATDDVHGIKLTPDGKMTEFDFPGATDTFPGQNNNRGEIVGYYDLGDFTGTGFLLRGGKYTVLNDPPDAEPMQNYPLGINDFGVIVGQFLDPDFNSHGFILRDGVYTTVDVPEAVFTYVSQLNDLGQAVGVYISADDSVVGFVLETRENLFSSVLCPGGLHTETNAINNRGQLAGTCRTIAGGPRRGFVATPRE
jgi:hypothetical protein